MLDEMGKEKETEETTSSIGQKQDNGKLRYDLIPVEVLESVVAVLTEGAKKYSDNNWKNVPNANNRYYAAAMRHLESWRKGDLIDKEDNLPHLSHAICCLTFLLYKQLCSTEN